VAPTGAAPGAAWGQPAVPAAPRGRIAAAAAAAAAAALRADAAAGAEEGKRPVRCTGSALGAAASLLTGCVPKGGARATVFTGGPCVGGAGAIVGSALTETIRGHTDVQERKDAGARRRAVAHYARIATRARAQGHALDLVSGSLEETGLLEMSGCVSRSGGVALQAETFGADHLRASLRQLLRRDGRGELQLGYGARHELITSKECDEASPLFGGEEEAEVQTAEGGEARRFSWSVGALGAHSCTALSLRRGPETLPGERDSHLLQLCTTYRSASGKRRVRVSTLRMPRPVRPVPPRALLPALDQQAAAALLVRSAVQQAARGAAPADLLKSIDRKLIDAMRAVCEYRKGDPASVTLPPQAAQLPGLVFNLRRSPAVRTTNVSPDETAYFRLLASTLSVFATLVLVQPTLTAHAPDAAPAPLPLEPHSMTPERALLLDTFLQVGLCVGFNLANAQRAADGEGVKQIDSVLEAARAQRDKLAEGRFPAPLVYECEQYGSKARYLTQKLNPDVPMNTFLAGLYQAIVA
jgi:protein transport protein SEC23